MYTIAAATSHSQIELYLYNLTPLNPTSVYSSFLISAPKHILWILMRTALERRFSRVPSIYILSQNMQRNIRIWSENFQFLVVKISIYLNRRVFVMKEKINRLRIDFTKSIKMSINVKKDKQCLYPTTPQKTHDRNNKQCLLDTSTPTPTPTPTPTHNKTHNRNRT